MASHDARENRIGETNNILFLTQLTHLWRSELCRYAKSLELYVLPNHPDIYQPASMTSARWQDVILVLWSNLKAELNLVDEMVYMQGLAAGGSSYLRHSDTSQSKRPRQTQKYLRTIDTSQLLREKQSHRWTRSGLLAVTQETPCASQISLIITCQASKSHAKCPANIPIKTQSQRG
jgi:hypothetical protein